jgi:DNA polymerase-1
MYHHIYGHSPNNTYKVAVLIKEQTFLKDRIRDTYFAPLWNKGLKPEDSMAMSLEYDDPKKVSAKTVKAYVAKILPVLKNLEVKYLYVCDATYFKALTGEKKAEPYLGYVMPCCHKGYEEFNIVYGVSYQRLVYDPELRAQVNLGLDALHDHMNGQYTAPGEGIIHSEWYPDTTADIAKALQFLKQFDKLTCDIEAFDLGIEKAGIGTIQFAWDKHNFVAFKVDLQELSQKDAEGNYSKRVDNPVRRKLVREFFETYEGAMIYHSAIFDVKHLVYNLFMTNPLDRVGMVDGLHVMTRNLHCTKVMAYLATNSCAGNTLGLKYLAQEYAGNWAVDEIHDIRKIPVDTLLRYNGVDGLCTFYVAEKYYPLMVADQQLNIYETLFRPSLKLLIHTELVGMPMCPKKVVETKAKLETLHAKYLAAISKHPTVLALNEILQRQAMAKANAKLKTKQHPLSHFSDVVFNPGSPLQLQKLLYEVIGLPVTDYTDSKQPATGGKIIKKLMAHPLAEPHKDLLQSLRDWSAVAKILQGFMPAFENGQLKADGMRYLHGAFNLGGTVSGRLSSSDPNMQNIPAGSAYGKLIKEMFIAPEGWLFVGADFASLEDRISALITKDPNKLKVYTDGFDGHALRAVSYWPDEMPDIDPNNVQSVNAIAEKGHKYGKFRQDSKTPTFLLTYGGTHHGMMKQLGWTKEKSMIVEERYHDLYKVSDEFIAERIKRACTDGYVEVAFGLRVRTPMLARSILDTKVTPYESAAEGRTAGNAMGQSYGLLNNRAGIAFMESVYASKYRYDIHPCAWIHDAGYYLIKQDLGCLKFANDGIVKEMSWQDLPDIKHDEVKLGADLDLFYPSWANAVTLPNNASEAELKAVCDEHLRKLAA